MTDHDEPRRLTLAVWSTVAAGFAAWLLLIQLYGRYATHDRYSGMGVIALLWLGLVPAAALALAVVSHLRLSGRRWIARLAIAVGSLPVLALCVTVANGEQRLARVHREEERRDKVTAAAEAELEALELEAIVAIANGSDPLRSRLAVSIGVRKLEALVRECGADPSPALIQTATLAMTNLTRTEHLVFAVFYDVAKSACEPLRAPLKEAFLTGVVRREGAASDGFTLSQLLDLEASGALVRQARARLRFSEGAELGAVEEEIVRRSEAGNKRALLLVQLGVTAARADRPLSQVLAEVCRERNAAWPAGARADELALYEALRVAEARRE